MLQGLADGDTDAAALAAMAEPELKATPEQLADALSAAATLSALHRQILRLFLERLDLIERQVATLHQTIASAMQKHHEAVLRLAATFASAGELASWVGVCPGREESAEEFKSNRTPKGNRAMRRVLNQVANAARKTKGSVFQAM